jgi:hypothetical protein
MDPIKVNFIGQVNEEEVELLKNGYAIITKLIVSKEDFTIFHYNAGDPIQVETAQGNRLWCTIITVDPVENEENVIIILKLVQLTEQTGR